MTLQKTYSEWIREHWMLVLPLLVFNVLVWPHVFFIPIWDAFQYFECIQEPLKLGERFPVPQLFCRNHPTVFFVGPLSLVYLLNTNSIVPVNIALYLLGTIAVIGVYLLLLKIVTDKTQAALGTLLFASHPIVLANAVYLTPDIFTVYYYVLFLCALFYKRLALATILGTALVLTKESGLMYYTTTLIAYALSFHRTELVQTKQWPSLLQQLRHLLIPLAFYGLYLLIHTIGWPEEGAIKPRALQTILDTDGSIINAFIHISPFATKNVQPLQELLVMHFHWVYSLVIIAALIRWIRKRERASQTTVCIAVSTLLGAYILTRYVPHSLPRYLLLAHFSILMVVVVSVSYLFQQKKAASVVLLVLFGLNVSSHYASPDPVSQYVYGTFSVGQQKGLCNAHHKCGTQYSLRDHIVYNLSYTGLSSLQDDMFAWVRPTQNTVIVTLGEMWHGFKNGVDPSTYERSIHPTAIHPQYTKANRLVTMKLLPEEIIFVDYPNVEDMEKRAFLDQYYNTHAQKTFARRGMEVAVYRMKRNQNERE